MQHRGLPVLGAPLSRRAACSLNSQYFVARPVPPHRVQLLWPLPLHDVQFSCFAGPKTGVLTHIRPEPLQREHVNRPEPPQPLQVTVCIARPYLAGVCLPAVGGDRKGHAPLPTHDTPESARGSGLRTGEPDAQDPRSTVLRIAAEKRARLKVTTPQEAAT